MMQPSELQPGALVRAAYKTGEYIGEVVEPPSAVKVAVQIKAVLKHPTQGDLHHPMDPDVGFFHQRRALAFREIALMPLDTIRAYHGTVPEYETSLRQALEQEREQLDRMVRWAQRCLQELDTLRGEYRL